MSNTPRRPVPWTDGLLAALAGALLGALIAKWTTTTEGPRSVADIRREVVRISKEAAELRARLEKLEARR